MMCSSRFQFPDGATVFCTADENEVTRSFGNKKQLSEIFFRNNTNQSWRFKNVTNQAKWLHIFGPPCSSYSHNSIIMLYCRCVEHTRFTSITSDDNVYRANNNPLECRDSYRPSASSNDMKLVHWPLMGGLLHLVQRGGD